ncbi:MAG: STAS domain-containing protein [Sulfuricella sp.]
MNLHQENRDGRCRLDIDGGMTIYEAAELKPALLKSLEASYELEVSLAGVTEMDSAGFQLLCLLKRESLERGKKLSFVEHSCVVLDVLDLFNMASFFGDPLLIPSDKLH